jgi:hypothetical protein
LSFFAGPTAKQHFGSCERDLNTSLFAIRDIGTLKPFQVMVDPKVARQQIDQRIRHLRALSRDQLKGLPTCVVEDIRFGDEIWSITTYRATEGDAVRIVVQIGPPQPKFMLLRVQADGFRLHTNGSVTGLPARELDEFR